MRPDTHHTLLAAILLALMFHGARGKCYTIAHAQKQDGQGFVVRDAVRREPAMHTQYACTLHPAYLQPR